MDRSPSVLATVFAAAFVVLASVSTFALAFVLLGGE